MKIKGQRVIFTQDKKINISIALAKMLISVFLIVSFFTSIQSLTCQQCTGTGYECQDGLDNGFGTECGENEKCWFQHGKYHKCNN